MGAQKGSFLGVRGSGTLDLGSGTLDLGSGRPFLTIFGPQIWDGPHGPPPHTKQPPRYGFWRASGPSKGSILGHFWAIFDHFWWGPLRGPSLRATGIWMFWARGPKTAIFCGFLALFRPSDGKEGALGEVLWKRPLISRPLEGVSNLCSQNTGQFFSFLKMRKI